LTKAWCSGVHAIAHSYHHRNCTFASSEISHTHTHTHIYAAFHIAFILSYFDSKQTILHWIILSTPLNPTQPPSMIYEAVQNHYKWRWHASEVSPAGSWLYRVYTPLVIHHSFIHLGTCCLRYLNGWCSCVFRLMRSSTPINFLGFIIFCWLLQEVKLLF
jgi:hypothetical protein